MTASSTNCSGSWATLWLPCTVLLAIWVASGVLSLDFPLNGQESFFFALWTITLITTLDYRTTFDVNKWVWFSRWPKNIIVIVITDRLIKGHTTAFKLEAHQSRTKLCTILTEYILKGVIGWSISLLLIANGWHRADSCSWLLHFHIIVNSCWANWAVSIMSFIFRNLRHFDFF